MKREEYRSLLGRLPIKNPTAADMAMLCPHLTAEEAVEAFTTGSGFVAAPPLRIRHGFQILSYHKEWVEGISALRFVGGKGKNHPAKLCWSYAGRTHESYANGRSHSDASSPHYVHADRAMKFAEDNWGDELILDDWTSVVEIYVGTRPTSSPTDTTPTTPARKRSSM